MRLWTAPATARTTRPGRPGPLSRPCSGSSSRTLPLVEWPFSDPSAAVVSLMPPSLSGLATAARSAQRIGARQEAADQPVRLIRALDLRHVAAAVDDDLLGARKPPRDVPFEAGRDQGVVRAPDEQRRPLEVGQARVEAVLAEGLVQVDVARRAEEGEAGAAGTVCALELVDDDIADVRVHRVGVVEQAAERRRDAGAPEVMGEEGELGPGEPDD